MGPIRDQDDGLCLVVEEMVGVLSLLGLHEGSMRNIAERKWINHLVRLPWAAENNLDSVFPSWVIGGNC